MKCFSLCLVLGSLLAGGCQSARLATSLPATSPYGVATPRPAPTTTDYSESVATLSTLTASTAPNSLPAPQWQPAKDSERPPALAPDHSSRLLTPDTVVRRPPAPGPDPATTRTNIIGGAIAAAGIGLLLTADIEDYARNLTTDRTNFSKVLGGLFLTILGVVLAFNQGKNGRRRLAREAHRAERIAKNPPEIISEAEAERRRKKASRRTGLYLILGGALLGGLGFLLNPLTTIAFFLLGSVLVVTGLLLATGFL